MFFNRPMHEFRRRAGFSTVEMIVMTGIIMVISLIILVRFPSLSDTLALQRATRELALNIRRAQNMTLAARRVEFAPSDIRTPPAFGVAFDRAATPGQYVIFADFFPIGNPNGRYDPQVGSEDKLVETVPLPPGVVVSELVSDLGLTNQQEDVLNVTFDVPEGVMDIQDNNGQAGEAAEIFLFGQRSGFSRSVIVRTTGQVRVR